MRNELPFLETRNNMTKQEIAEQFVNGQRGNTLFSLILNAEGKSEIPEKALGRAFDVYQFIRGQYGSMKALEFSNWLQTFSDLK